MYAAGGWLFPRRAFDVRVRFGAPLVPREGQGSDKAAAEASERCGLSERATRSGGLAARGIVRYPVRIHDCAAPPRAGLLAFGVRDARRADADPSGEHPGGRVHPSTTAPPGSTNATRPCSRPTLRRVWRWTGSGNRTRTAGATAQLIEEYRRASAAATTDLAPSLLLGHFLQAGGNVDEAAAAYERAARLNPASPLPTFARAELALVRRNPATRPDSSRPRSNNCPRRPPPGGMAAQGRRCLAGGGSVREGVGGLGKNRRPRSERPGHAPSARGQLRKERPARAGHRPLRVHRSPRRPGRSRRRAARTRPVARGPGRVRRRARRPRTRPRADRARQLALRRPPDPPHPALPTRGPRPRNSRLAGSKPSNRPRAISAATSGWNCSRSRGGPRRRTQLAGENRRAFAA